MSFSETLPECAKCPFAIRCKPEAERRRESLRIKFGINPKKRAAKPQRTSTAPPHTLVDDVPKKVVALLQSFEKSGIVLGAALREGRNPFDRAGAFNFMWIACEILLRFPAGVRRDTLSKTLEKHLNVTRETAASHAMQASRALRALGLANESPDGTITLKRIVQ